MDAEFSFVDWLARLQNGEERARSEVFLRLSDRLRTLARKHLDQGICRLVEPDDILQSAFRSFFVHQADGQYQLDDWNGLWGLLALIAVRKCLRQNEFHHAARRDISCQVNPTVSEDESAVIFEAISREPSPEEAAIFAETLAKAFGDEDERGRSIVAARLQRYNHLEISQQCGCSERTVRRVLKRTQKRLEAMLEN